MATEKLNTIEDIIKTIKKKTNAIIKIKKLDAITAECYVPTGDTTDKAQEEVKNLCSELNLLPVATEVSSENNNKFALQFPDFEPKYTDKQITKMYNSNFKWLLDNLFKTDKNNKIDKNLLVTYRDMLVKQAITTYFNSNVNKYKSNIKDYLDNKDYRDSITTKYLVYLDEYIEEK